MHPDIIEIAREVSRELIAVPQLEGIERELEAARRANDPEAYPPTYVAALRQRRAQIRKDWGIPPVQNQFKTTPHHKTDSQ